MIPHLSPKNSYVLFTIVSKECVTGQCYELLFMSIGKYPWLYLATDNTDIHGYNSLYDLFSQLPSSSSSFIRVQLVFIRGPLLARDGYYTTHILLLSAYHPRHLRLYQIPKYRLAFSQFVF